MITTILIFIFGKNQKQRFKRVIIFMLISAVIIILTLNVSFEWSKKAGWSFKWAPAADIKIEKK